MPLSFSIAGESDSEEVRMYSTSTGQAGLSDRREVKSRRGQERGGVGGRRVGSSPSVVREGSAEKVIFEQRLARGEGALWLPAGCLLGGGRHAGKQDWQLPRTAKGHEEGAECEGGEWKRSKVMSQVAGCQRGAGPDSFHSRGSC